MRRLLFETKETPMIVTALEPKTAPDFRKPPRYNLGQTRPKPGETEAIADPIAPHLGGVQ